MGPAIDRMIAEQAPGASTQQGAESDDSPARQSVPPIQRRIEEMDPEDAQFWVQVAQLAVLLLILRRVSA